MTVSRVVNHHPNVSDTTRERVAAAIAELGFHPSRTARALALSSSRGIGVLDATRGQLYGPASTMAAIAEAARARDYSVMIAVMDPAVDASVESATVHLLDEGAVALIMVGPGAGAGQVVRASAPGVPFAAMHSAVDGERALVLDQVAGGRTAARHLLELGHTQLAHLGGPPYWLEASSRREGFVAELARSGLVPVVTDVGDWTAESGYVAGHRMLAAGGFTAVFCANDQMALGLLHAARDAGVTVPDQLSVVGFDDIPEAAHYHPALTTVRQDFAQLGARAVATVLAEFEGAEPPVWDPPETPLIIRGSTARPAGRA